MTAEDRGATPYHPRSAPTKKEEETDNLQGDDVGMVFIVTS